MLNHISLLLGSVEVVAGEGLHSANKYPRRGYFSTDRLFRYRCFRLLVSLFLYRAKAEVFMPHLIALILESSPCACLRANAKGLKGLYHDITIFNVTLKSPKDIFISVETNNNGNQ